MPVTIRNKDTGALIYEGLASGLAGVDLSNALLRGINTSSAPSPNWDFQGANFSGCNLSYADMSGSSMGGTNMSGANLTGTSLGGSTLSGVTFDGARFDGTNFNDCSINGGTAISLSYSQNCSFVGTYMGGTNIEGTYFVGCNFTGAYLQGISGGGTSGGIVTGSILTGAVLEGLGSSIAINTSSILKDVYYKSCSANLSDSLENSIIESIAGNIGGLAFYKCKFLGSWAPSSSGGNLFDYCDFNPSFSFSVSSMSGYTFNYCTLYPSNFSSVGSQFGTTFNSCTLSGTSGSFFGGTTTIFTMNNCQMSYANLDSNDLTSCQFNNCRLLGCTSLGNGSWSGNTQNNSTFDQSTFMASDISFNGQDVFLVSSKIIPEYNVSVAANSGNPYTAPYKSTCLAGNLLPAPSTNLARVYHNCNLDSVRVTGDFSSAEVKGSSLEDCVFAASSIAFTKFEGCSLIGANFSGMDLSGASFRGSDLTGANFSSASLSGCNFRGALVRSTNFTSATGLDLTGAIIDSSSFDTTVSRVGWATTWATLGTPVSGTKSSGTLVAYAVNLTAGTSYTFTVTAGTTSFNLYILSSFQIKTWMQTSDFFPSSQDTRSFMLVGDHSGAGGRAAITIQPNASGLFYVVLQDSSGAYTITQS